jgi:hypothetical protein
MLITALIEGAVIPVRCLGDAKKVVAPEVV